MPGKMSQSGIGEDAHKKPILPNWFRGEVSERPKTRHSRKHRNQRRVNRPRSSPSRETGSPKTETNSRRCERGNHHRRSHDAAERKAQRDADENVSAKWRQYSLKFGMIDFGTQ